MSYELITVYAVYTTTDEAGSTGSCLGYCARKEGAAILAKGQGWYGGDARIVTVPAIRVDAQVFILENKIPVVLDKEAGVARQKLKDATLAKLSPTEREALGI